MSSDPQHPQLPRSRDAEATRLALLQAARRRFTLLGYDRTTTREVARDAGVNLALINRYFGGKEGLFQAVLAELPATLAEAPSATGDPIGDFLDGILPGAWAEFGEHPLLLLLRESSADEKTQGLRAAAMDTGVRRILDAGEATADDARLRAQLVLALFSGILTLRSVARVEPLASADIEELRPAIQDAVDALLRRPP